MYEILKILFFKFDYADSRRHDELMGVDEEGFPKTGNDLLCNLNRVFYSLQVGQDQCKLVTTQTCNDSTLPQRCGEPLCRCLEEEIPHIMPQRKKVAWSVPVKFRGRLYWDVSIPAKTWPGWAIELD